MPKSQKSSWIVGTRVALVIGGGVAEAQQRANIPKIGWLGGRSPSGPGGAGESFRRALGALGYIEGTTITIEYRYAQDKLDRLPALADELVRLNVDLLIAPTTVEVRAAKNATKTIPIVFYNVPDPVGSGLVDSLARPGANITGFSTINALLSGKRLELLNERFPSSLGWQCCGTRRIRHLYNNGKTANSRLGSWDCNYIPCR
jgi:putative tryptophan/tyrosine transport system substrate-binding protein